MIKGASFRTLETLPHVSAGSLIKTFKSYSVGWDIRPDVVIDLVDRAESWPLRRRADLRKMKRLAEKGATVSAQVHQEATAKHYREVVSHVNGLLTRRG